MLVTVDNYKEGAEVKFTPSSYTHYVEYHLRNDFKAMYPKICVLPPKNTIKDYSIRNMETDDRTYWISLKLPDQDEAIGACISDTTHNATPGYFLEYTHSIDSILKNLTILEKRYEGT